MVRDFARVTGDFNPVHIDEAFARNTRFGRPIAHGMLVGGLISKIPATSFPGPGAIYMSQNMTFVQPVFHGDILVIHLEITEIIRARNALHLSTTVTNEEG